VTLISNDTKLCRQAECFKLRTVHNRESERWRKLLTACGVDERLCSLLPGYVTRTYRQTSIPKEDEEEMATRKYRCRELLIQMNVICIEDYDTMELPPRKNFIKWLDRPIIESVWVYP
jgi:hypothetical protein